MHLLKIRISLPIPAHIRRQLEGFYLRLEPVEQETGIALGMYDTEISAGLITLLHDPLTSAISNLLKHLEISRLGDMLKEINADLRQRPEDIPDLVRFFIEKKPMVK